MGEATANNIPIVLKPTLIFYRDLINSPSIYSWPFELKKRISRADASNLLRVENPKIIRKKERRWVV